MKYEYQVETLDWWEVQALLDKMAAQDWRVHTFTAGEHHQVHVLFERLLPGSQNVI